MTWQLERYKVRRYSKNLSTNFNPYTRTIKISYRKTDQFHYPCLPISSRISEALVYSNLSACRQNVFFVKMKEKFGDGKEWFKKWLCL